MKMPPASCSPSSWVLGFAMLVSAIPLTAQNLHPPNGAQIAWSSEAFATNLRADGMTTFEEALDQIRFELGTFSPGFDPRNATLVQWVENWIPLQGADYDFADQQFIQTATLDDNLSPFAAGSQAYIWGFTSKEVKPESEWILLGASEWKWPSSTSFEPSVFTIGQADPMEALFGWVNPSSGRFQMQLQLVAIPEPSSAFLCIVAALGAVFRRQRHPR